MTTARFDRRLLAERQPLCGRVVAIHSHAAVVRVEPAGRLLTLLPPRRWLVPWGIALADWETCPPDGAVVTVAGRTCQCEEKAVVSFQGDGVDLGIPARSLSTTLLQRQLTALGRLEIPAAGEMEQLAIRTADQRLDRTVAALVGGGGAGSVGSAIRSLVGLGPGSTPTGDDLIVGVAAAACRFRGAGELAADRFDALREALRAVPTNATTPVSIEMLRHAAEGQFLEPLGHLANAMGSETRAPLAAAISVLRGIGARSGVDLAHGALALARAALGN